MDDFKSLTADDIYEILIKLHFPEETAIYFKNEMKDGFYAYISQEEVPIFKTLDVVLLTVYGTLVSHVFGKPNKIKFPYNSSNPFNIHDEPWPRPNLNVPTLIKQPSSSLPPTSTSTTVSLQQPVESKEVTTSIELSQDSIEILEDETRPGVSNSVLNGSSRPSVLQPITNFFQRSKTSPAMSNNSAKSSFGVENLKHEPIDGFVLSNIKVFICERCVTLPRFSCAIEDCLQTSDECLLAVPNMCGYLAEYFFKNNIDVRTASEYKLIAEAILHNYEILDGIINRHINVEYEKKKTATRPKSYTYITKELSTAMKRLRNKKKEKEKKQENHTNAAIAALAVNQLSNLIPINLDALQKEM